MNLVLVAAGLALVALPGWTSHLGRRLQPRDWARLSSVSLWAGLVAVRLGLAVTAAPTALRAVGVHHLSVTCHQLLGPLTPGGELTAWGTLAVLVALQARIATVRHRCRRNLQTMWVEPCLGQHHARRDHELVVVPTASSLAYAVEGDPSQVVVSDGLTRILSQAELDAVVRHERCHLQHGHHRHLELARVVEGAFPAFGAARRSAATLRLAVERWADEAAAAATGRAPLRRALEKVVVSMLDAVPAFTTAETIGARLDALDATPRSPVGRWNVVAATVPLVALTGVVGVALLTGSSPIHHGALSLVDLCSF